MNRSIVSLRRTAAELLAAAVLELFPGASLLRGEGSHLAFHYDFIFPFSFQKEFLPLLEERMRFIAKEKRPIFMREMVPQNAVQFFKHLKQFEKAALLEEVDDSLVSIFEMGGFFDVCLGPYPQHSGESGCFKLLDATELSEIPNRFQKLEFQHSRRPKFEPGEAENQFLKHVGYKRIRIRGNAFFEKEELKRFLKKFHHFEGKDHVTRGRERGLYTSYKKGLWQWLPKGEILRSHLLDWWKEEHRKQNFQFVITPKVATFEELTAAHCPFSPRVAEIGFFESEWQEGEESEGMFRSQAFTCDIAHLFCGKGDLLYECISSLQFITKISKILSFEWQLALCVGSLRQSALWKKTSKILEKALEKCGLTWTVDEESPVDCGPRIEVRIADGLGRFWPTSFLKVDLFRSCIVRSMFGPLERFVALLVEQETGSLPFWLAPEQVRVFTVGAFDVEAAKQCVERLSEKGLRVWLDDRTEEKLPRRLHEALKEMVPYCIFIGSRERDLAMIPVRTYNAQKEELMKMEVLIQKLIEQNRKIDIEN
jgi:threonyl-tRNA synthetase